jgi:hypothetical protein
VKERKEDIGSKESEMCSCTCKDSSKYSSDHYRYRMYLRGAERGEIGHRSPCLVMMKATTARGSISVRALNETAWSRCQVNTPLYRIPHVTLLDHCQQPYVYKIQSYKSCYSTISAIRYAEHDPPLLSACRNDADSGGLPSGTNS